jgi:hypothetical protein
MVEREDSLGMSQVMKMIAKRLSLNLECLTVSRYMQFDDEEHK